MTATLAQLTTPLSVDDASATIYTALAARGIDVTLWKAGSVVRTIVAALAIIVAALSSLISLIAASGFLKLSRGKWLRFVALYVYNVGTLADGGDGSVSDGTFSTGLVTFTNSGAGVYVGIPIGNLVVKNPTTGAVYRNTALCSIFAFGSSNIAMQADVLGSGGTSGAATITTMVSVLAGVTCSNAAALVGRDADADATVQLLCSEKLGTLSPNGAPDAYAFVARSAVRADGSSIGVSRVRTVPDGVGGIDLYVATPSGGVSGSVGPSVGDLGVIDDAIQARTVPRAVTNRTHSATTLAIGTTYELWIPSTNTQTDAQILAAVDAALLAFISSRDIGGDMIGGGFVFKTALEDVVGAVVVGTKKRAVTVPAADVAIGATQAPIMAANTCTAIHRVVGASL